MKGYTTDSGYMGYIPDTNTYELFSTESDYREYYQENYIDTKTK